MHSFSDRPGRYIAAFGIGPAAVAAGATLLSCDTPECRYVVGVLLLVFGPLMTGYELFWICRSESELVILKS
jgi:hypothetical protein